MLARHPHSAERVKSLVSRIEEHAELMTPEIASAFERLVSAAVSSIPGRLQPADALACLQETEVVGMRRERAAAMEQQQLKDLRDAEAAMSLAFSREEERMRRVKGGARAAKRAAIIGEVAPPKKQRFDSCGRSHVTD